METIKKDITYIKFDSTNWDSIKDTYEKVKKINRAQFGYTDDGSSIRFTICEEDHILTTEISQKYGRLLCHRYDLDNKTVEEYHV